MVVVAALDIADRVVVAGVVAAGLGRVDIVGYVLVGVVAAELGRVDIAGSLFVGVVAAGLGKIDIAGAVAVGLGKIGTADVDRHRWVVPWPPSCTVDQCMVGFLNSHSFLGWSNYIVGELFPDRQAIGQLSPVLEMCSHWWVDRWNHSTMQRVLHLWQNSSCLEGLSNSLFYIRQRE